MASQFDERLIDIYAFLMNDIKVRVSSIEKLLKLTKGETEHRIALGEACYLQIRKICELLALALAVAHNDVPNFPKSKTLKDWQADKLVKTMLRLNEKGFPNRVRNNDNAVPPAFEKEATNLNAKHFVSIYNACGEKLHMGTLKHLYEKRPIFLDFSEISSWVSDFIGLLSNHLIDIGIANRILVCSMNSLEHDGKVHCYFMKEVVS